MASYVNVHDEDVIYHLRDTNKDVVESWTKVFSCYPGNFKAREQELQDIETLMSRPFTSEELHSFAEKHDLGQQHLE